MGDVYRVAPTGAASNGESRDRLACCHGYVVAAGGQSVGVVETPSFAGAAAEPDYLIVRAGSPLSGTFRAVPVALVERVDPDKRTVVLSADVDTVSALPHRLPLGRRTLEKEEDG